MAPVGASIRLDRDRLVVTVRCAPDRLDGAIDVLVRRFHAWQRVTTCVDVGVLSAAMDLWSVANDLQAEWPFPDNKIRKTDGRAHRD